MEQNTNTSEIKFLLEKLRLSKGFRSLKNDLQAVIKVSILSRNEKIIAQIKKLLKQENEGLVFDSENARLIVNQALNVDKPKHVEEYKEALSKKEDQNFLEKLMTQFNEESEKNA